MEPRTSDLPFHYDPLDLTDAKEVRFVRVSPKTRDGLLDCEIWHGEASTKFIALSYNQNPLSGDQQIFLNGRLSQIERALWDFLAVARVLFPQQAFWTDAICIDHDHEGEKNRQIKLAPQMYSLASEVLVWLGPNEFYASHAIDVLGKEVWDPQYKVFPNPLVTGQNDNAVRFWVGVFEILLNSYWQRAETIQEFSLSTNGTIMQGEHLISVDSFRDKLRKIGYRLSGNPKDIYKDLHLHLQKMLKISGIQALWRVRELVQNQCTKSDIRLATCTPLSFEVPGIWEAVVNTSCGNIKKRISAILALTKHGSRFEMNFQMNPFQLFLESIWLVHDSEDIAHRVGHLAQLLDLTPASILMYTKKPGETFRIPGTKKNGVASAENKSLHELSSFSRDDQTRWEATGLANPSPQLGSYYLANDLTDLSWMIGTGDSEKFAIPKRCQLRIVMRARPKYVFIVLGVHFSDDSIGSCIQGSTDMMAAIETRDLSEDEFEAQAIKCCCEQGIYETRCTPSKMTVYYAIFDGSVYDEDEIESRRLKYYSNANDRSLSVGTTSGITSTTPLPGPLDVLTGDSDAVHATDVSAEAESELDVKWEHSTQLSDHKSSVGKVAFSPNGSILASYSTDDTIRLWKTTTGLTKGILRGFEGRAKNLAFSADGDFLAHEVRNGDIQIWRLATEETCQTLVGLSKWGQVTAVAFSPDSKLVASSNINQSKIRLWNLMAGDQPELLEDYGHFAAVTALAFSPNGKLLVSGSVDKSLVIWDLAKKVASQILRGHTGTIVSVAFSPDSSLVASASPDKTIRLWQLETKMTAHILEGHRDAVSSVCFSPSGKLIVSGSDDGTIRLWDIETGETRRKLAGHRNAVTSVAFAPNGRTIASSSEDSTVRLWGVKKNEGPTVLGQLDFHRRAWTREIAGLLRKAGYRGDSVILETQWRGRNRDRGKKTDDDEGYELEEISDQPSRQPSEDLTHRRTYARMED